MNKDYRVKVSVRNANLLRAIEEAGYTHGNKFAALVGVDYIQLNRLVTCKASPVNKRTGDYKPITMKLCEFLNKTPSELFSDSQLEALNTSAVEFEANIEECLALSNPYHNIDNSDLQNLVDDILLEFTKREQDVLRLRYGIDCKEHTLDEIAATKGITKERVRQIEAKALRKLRNPFRSELLRPYAEERLGMRLGKEVYDENDNDRL